MQKKPFYVLLLLLAGLMQTACGQKNLSLSVDEFDKKLAATPEAQLIDVRTPEEYTKGHLKNAANWNISDGQFESNLSELDKSKPVFVYCLSGGRSGSAATILAQQGFKEVYNMDGGFMKWSQAGKEMETAVAASADEFSAGQFEQTIKNTPLVLVDFSAVWCGPCKQLKPIVHKLETEFASKLKVVNVDIDKNPSIAKDKNIEALPTLMLYKNGQLVWQQIGLTDEATLRSQINQYVVQ